MNVLVRAVEHLNQLITRAMGAAMAMLLASMAILVIASVIFRYVLNSSLTWGEEATRYMDAWLVFVGLAVAHRVGAHVRITLLFDSTPKKYRRWVEGLSEAIVLLLLIALAVLGSQLVASNFERGQMTPALRIPIAWVYLAVPVGLGLMALQSLERLLKLLIGMDLPQDPAAAQHDATA